MIAEQENPLPQELAELGCPEQVHPARDTSTSLILLCSGIFFLLSSALCVFIYMKVPFKKDDSVPPEMMLYIAAGIACVGLLCCLGAWLKGDFGKRPEEGYVIYPEALVWLQKDSCAVVRWNEIKALLSPRNLGDYHVETQDGRTIPIKHGVKDYSNLIGTVYSRVSSEIIAPLQSDLAAGKVVTFGPFEVGPGGIAYKGKVLAWDDVAVLRIEIGSLGRRLRLRASGSLLPWCYCNLESFPNGVLFPDLLRVVCPSRLLVPLRSVPFADM
ncbi:MAG: hypothetical protein HY290_09865 [Planctomycetia bacterium]|nr:hypothetical protein [Planctomycetia bacterium]